MCTKVPGGIHCYMFFQWNSQCGQQFCSFLRKSHLYRNLDKVQKAIRQERQIFESSIQAQINEIVENDRRKTEEFESFKKQIKEVENANKIEIQELKVQGMLIVPQSFNLFIETLASSAKGSSSKKWFGKSSTKNNLLRSFFLGNLFLQIFI